MDHTNQTFLHPDNDNGSGYSRVPSPSCSVKSHASTKSATRSLVESTAQFSFTVSSAPTEVKAALTRVAPDGERCLITRADGELECTYLIARSTDAEIRKALEAAWGMETGKLDLNAIQNIFWWLLLPTEEDLQAAIDFSNGRADQQTLSDFRTVYSDETWKYHFLSLDYKAIIFRYDDDLESYTPHKSPYPDLGPVESHLSPFHIIYNVGEKVHDIKDPEYEGHCKLPEDPSYRPLLDECEALYLLWVGSLLETSESSTQQSDLDQSSIPTFHRACVDNWLTGIRLSAPCEDPLFGGTEQAEQLLVQYKHEEAREPPRGTWKKWIPEYELV